MNPRTPDRVLIGLIAIVALVCFGAWAIENGLLYWLIYGWEVC